MKVISVEKKEYEVVTFDTIGKRIYRRDCSGNWDSLQKDFADKLEAAYQHFKNPPFEIEIEYWKDDKYKVFLNGFLVAIDTEECVKGYKNNLIQALNSLMEGK